MEHPETILLNIGGKARRFKLGPAAFRIARLKHDTSLSMAEMSSPSFDVFATLAWIGLLPDNHDLTEIEVMTWLGAEDCDEAEVMADVATALNRMVEGMSAAFGDDTKKKRSPKRGG